MPCRDEYQENVDARRATEQAHRTTELLCMVLTELSDHYPFILSGLGGEKYPDLKAWWIDHQRLDRIREEREAEDLKKNRAKEMAAIAYQKAMEE